MNPVKFCLPVLLGLAIAGPAASQGVAFEEARQSAATASFTINKVQRWLHEAALKKIEPGTGLYRPDGEYNYETSWADCYPFLAWAAWLTDLEALNGPVRDALHAEIRYCPEGFFAKPENTFGGSEYVKDGLAAIVEITGRDEWFERMQAVEDELWSNPTVQTVYGPIPSSNLEVNGEQLQVLARLYAMTGEKKYLDWAERIADHYLLAGDFVPERLRDHGCEIMGGLGLLLGVESVCRPEKARQYRPLIKTMLDTVLEKGTNADGFMHDWLGPRGRLSDSWGYNYVACLCFDMATSTPVYRARVEGVLRSLAKPAYRDHVWEGCNRDGPAASLECFLRDLARPVYRNRAWEDRALDGCADAVEGAIYLLNRLCVPEGLAWADHEAAAHIVFADDSGHMWGTGKQHSNAVRTAIIHALMHTRGLVARPWRQDLRLGAHETRDGLCVVILAGRGWSGRLVPDIPRHRLYMGFSQDWPRINTQPEWFTVEPDQEYVVQDLTFGTRTVYTGRQLHAGLPLDLGPGEERLLHIGR